MALRAMSMGLALVLVSTLWAGAMAQSSSCMTTIVSLSPCLNYITGSSSTPSPPCCSQLATVVRSQPQCLCSVLNGGASSLGISINQTQALALPGACNVQTPPVSLCNAAGRPGASPAQSPEAEGPTPAASAGGETPNGSSTSLPSLLFFILLVASYAATLTSF